MTHFFDMSLFVGRQGRCEALFSSPVKLDCLLRDLVVTTVVKAAASEPDTVAASVVALVVLDQLHQVYQHHFAFFQGVFKGSGSPALRLSSASPPP